MEQVIANAIAEACGEGLYPEHAIIAAQTAIRVMHESDARLELAEPCTVPGCPGWC